MAGKSGIHIKPENKGKLHKTLGVAQDKKIPLSKLQAAKNSSNPKTRQRANFAISARKWNKG